jgi:hypothetical protein
MNGSPPSSPPSSNCPCEIPQDPQVVSNPPGLASITDRVDDFTGFRRALLRPLVGEQALGLWRPADGDLGLQFLEWWAYIADVLTFYNERIANETYLRTAQFPESVAGLVALLGYTPAPGLAATGQVGAIRTTTYPAEPLVIPAGMQLSSTATAGVPAQTFEAEAGSFPGLSDVVAVLAPDPALRVLASGSVPDAGPASVLLAGKVTGAKPGDGLLLVVNGWDGTDDTTWSVVTVAAVSPETDPGTGAVNTRVSFTSAAHWGTTAPCTTTASSRQATQYRLMKPTATASLWSLQGADLPQAHTDIGSDNYVLPDLASGQPGQSNWRWCSNCQGLFFAGNPTLGVCPAGGAHTDAGSDNYVLPDLASGQPGQSNWRWCSNCQGLFFAGGPTLGVCPAGGAHTDAGSDNYVLPDLASGQPGQSNWRWCSNCQGLFFAGNPTLGVCPAPGINLSATVRSIQPGDLVLFDGGTQFASVLSLVQATSDGIGKIPFPESLSPPVPDIVIPYTGLIVTTPTPDSGTLSGYTNPGAIAVRHGFRDVGTVLPNPQPPPPLTALPATVVVAAGFSLPAGVSTALLEDATGAGTVVQVAPAGTLDGASDGSVQLTLNPAPPAPATFDPPLQVPLRLLFDVVPVSRGTTVANEVLGSGNAAVANQRFTLSKSPLTYLASGAGWAAALAVYVNGIQWSEVPTLYNQLPGAQVYVVERAPDQSATIRFGDGVNGSRLTSGTGNVVATYRYGSGAASPPAGRLTTIVQRQPNLAAVHNPMAVAGGTDPQDPADVQTNAPASVFTFGRAISALDYEAVAAQAAGVTRVKAYWTFDAAEQRTLVKIYVNDDAGGVAAATQALAGSDDPNRPVTVAAASAIDVAVSANLVVAANRVVADVVAAATAAFTDPATGAFSPAQMAIGQWLYRSHLDAALSVPGAVAVHQLEVTWAAATLDQVADPGEGAYFQLLPANLTLTGVPANG